MNKSKQIEYHKQEIKKLEQQLKDDYRENYENLIGKCFNLATDVSYIKLTDILHVAKDHVEFECIGVDFNEDILKIEYGDEFSIRDVEIDYWLRREVSEREFKKFMTNSLNYHIEKSK